MAHKPVLLKEVLALLNLRPGLTVVDGTLGGGGHSVEMMMRIAPTGHLIALDQDPQALDRNRSRFDSAPCKVDLVHENFRNISEAMIKLNVPRVDAVLLDVGFSSDQLEDSKRGFSFDREGPLDMRMNPDLETTAADLVNNLSERELADLIFAYGEEHHSRRIAKRLCEYRDTASFETTQDLAEAMVVIECGPHRKKSAKKGFPGRRHPATRVFQALRIAVNDELGALQEGLDKSWALLSHGGRLGVITFHSLEDRIVKRTFLRWKADGTGVFVVKKPVTPEWAEVKDNPRARSAKLRVMEKL